MAEEEFIVLYTGQKTKKAKTWHDGTLKVLATGTKAVLFDDKNCRLDTVYVRGADVVLGEQIESDRYFILIEEKKTSADSGASDTVQPTAVVSKSCVGQSFSGVRCGVAVPPGRGVGGGGLSRKRAGFVPPRMVRTQEEPRGQCTESQATQLREGPATSLSPLQGMNSYRASIMNLYSRSRESNSQLRESPNNLASQQLPNVYDSQVSGHGFHIRGTVQADQEFHGQSYSSMLKCPPIDGNDQKVSPQLTNFMARLKDFRTGSQESGPGNRGKTSPWSTFGPRKSDSGSQSSQSSDGSNHSSQETSSLSNIPKGNFLGCNMKKSRIGESTGDLSIQTTSCVTKQQTNCPSFTGKRTASQIMALFRGSSSSHNSKPLSHEPQTGTETKDLNQDAENKHQPDKECPKSELANMSDLPSVGLLTNVPPDPAHSSDGAMEEEMFHQTDCDLKGTSESVELDPFDTSDATFDINFSPLSQVLSSEDEVENEQYITEHSDSTEKSNDSGMQTHEVCVESQLVDDCEVTSRYPVIEDVKIGSSKETHPGNKSPAEECLSSESALQSKLETGLADVSSGTNESDVLVKHEQIVNTWTSKRCMDLSQSDKKEEKISIIQKDSEKTDYNQNDEIVGNHIQAEMTARVTPSDMILPRSPYLVGQTLNDLQFSPDSFDLNSSLSQFSQSGFLETLNAASNKTSNLISETGSAFDDKPLRLFTDQPNTTIDPPDLKLNWQINTPIQSVPLGTGSFPPKNEYVHMFDEIADGSKAINVKSLLPVYVQDGRDELVRSGEAHPTVSDQNCVLEADVTSAVSRGEQNLGCEVMGGKCSSTCDKDRNDEQQNNNDEKSEVRSHPQSDFSDSSGQDIASKVFSQQDRGCEGRHRLSQVSGVSPMIPDTARNLACQNDLHELGAYFSEADSSFPLPDTPVTLRDNIPNSVDSAEIGHGLYESQLLSLHPDTNENKQFHTSTLRRYETSESMISVPHITGHRAVFGQNVTGSKGVGENKQTNHFSPRHSSQPVIKTTTGQLSKSAGSEWDDHSLPEDADVQDGLPEPMTVSTLPHPSRLYGDKQATQKEVTDIRQLASKHLEGYTIKGMVSSGMVRRQLQVKTHQVVKASLGETSRVTSGQLQQALHVVANSTQSACPSVISLDDLHTRHRHHPEQNFKLPSPEEFNLEISRVPTVSETECTQSIRELLNTEQFKFHEDRRSVLSPSTDLPPGRSSDDHWLVQDSQSSTSTAESAPGCAPSMGVHLKAESVQELHTVSDCLSQDDMEEDFYVDWNEGKPKFLSKPFLHKQHNKISTECQSVPLSPCLSSVSSPSDIGPQIVPRVHGDIIQEVLCEEEIPTEKRLRSVTAKIKIRKPLKTNPADQKKQETYDVYMESSGESQSDLNLSSLRNNTRCLHVPQNQRVTGGVQHVSNHDDYPETLTTLNVGQKTSVFDGRDGSGEITQSNLKLKSETPLLRTPYMETNQCVGTQKLEDCQTDRNSPCYKYMGSVRWQQSRLGHQEEVVEEEKEKKEESRWGRYLQPDEEDEGVTSQANQRPVPSFDQSHNKYVSNIDRLQLSNENWKSTPGHQVLNAHCDNFFENSHGLYRHINTAAAGDVNNPDIEFDESFYEALENMEEEHQQDRSQTSSISTNKLSFENTFKSHVSRLPDGDLISSRDLFTCQIKEKSSVSSKFTTPRFLNTRTYDHVNPQERKQTPLSVSVRGGKFKTPMLASLSNSVLQGSQRNLCGELQFPSHSEVETNITPARSVTIPIRFLNVQAYKQVITAAIKEHLNIQLFELSKLYHSGLGKVDVSCYSGQAGNMSSSKSSRTSNPPCKCGVPSKMVQVKKDGPNKGRFFYACEAPRNQQCKFFQWMDQPSSNGASKGGSTSVSRATLRSADSITAYIRSHGITFYCECRYLLKYRDNYGTSHRKGIPAWVRQKQEESRKKSMYIKLSRKDISSFFSRDDLWVVSQTLMFEQGTTFVARSSYFGPNSNNEVEIEPLAGYSPSNWTNSVECHAILAGNASTELACLTNLEENVHPGSLPILTHLLDKQSSDLPGGLSIPFSTKLCTPGQFVMTLAKTYICQYSLNEDQSAALMRVAAMMNKDSAYVDPVLLIHGVFGAGKSFLLSVLIRFLVEVFEKNDSYTPDVPFPWKLLISSTTNVAVDRVLMGLLNLGFEDFIRVGSVKKIAKPVLPYSVHASGSDSQELKDLQQMLRSDIPPSEKQLVRRSIEKHRLGENKKKLGGVRVVGVTCAACSFNCLNKIHFPFVVLDECSQMTEPSSMLPIAKFSCEKLVLVGDPKQLDPTIQGSEAGHTEGLEQTLFDRMMKLNYIPILLRTQYRCHPWISSIANTLFYNGHLQDGVTLQDRAPLTPMFPTLCFYDVANGQDQTDGSGSYYNVTEAKFVVLLIQGLVVEGVEAGSIGVITLYKAQMYKIMTSLHTDNPILNKEFKSIQVSTVDAFQGGERDIIILSCVRTNNFGFIDSDKRTNVALTRAKHHLLIVGHQQNLARNKLWSRVIAHCRDRPCGVQSSIKVTTELQKLIDEKLSHVSESASSQETGPNTDQGRKKRTGKRKRGKEEDSPPMSLSGQETENSGQSVVVLEEEPRDKYVDEDVLGAEDFVLSESTTNIPRPLGHQVRKRQRLSHLLDPDVFMEDTQNSSDEDLPDCGI